MAVHYLQQMLQTLQLKYAVCTLSSGVCVRCAIAISPVQIVLQQSIVGITELTVDEALPQALGVDHQVVEA